MFKFDFSFIKFMKRHTENEIIHLSEEQVSQEVDEYLKERHYLKSADDGTFINEEQPKIEFSLPEIKKKKSIEVTEINYERTKRNAKPGLF